MGADVRDMAQGALLVYDGDCGFCTRSAGWIARRLPAGYRAEPWQALDLGSLGLTEGDVTTAAYWIDGHCRHRGAAAVSRALMAAGGGWRPVGRLLGIPPASWLAAAGYRVIARNRHRLPGATDACRLPVTRPAGPSHTADRAPATHGA